MDHQPQQRFCTTCGQLLVPGAVFCVACGTLVSAPPPGAPGQVPTGAQASSPPPSAQAPMQAQNDPLLVGLAAVPGASRIRQDPLLRARRPRSRLRGCGCLMLLLLALTGPFIGVALTSGKPHLIFTYVAGGMVVLFFLMLLLGMLVSRRGREALSDGCAEGCLDALLGGFLGGG